MPTLPRIRSEHSWVSLARAYLRRILTTLALLSYTASPEVAAAKDFKALTNFVVPAYTAMNFAVVCRQDDPQFISRTSGKRGTAIHYAEHVKDEAITSLTNDEAVRVLKMAADEARSNARRELRKQAPDYPKAHPGEITNWCRNEASRFVRAFIEEHDSRHAALMQELEQAKR